MKLQFNPDLTYQKDAIDAVVGIFEGQETCRTTFTVTSAPVIDKHGQMDALAASEQNDLGIGNRLRLIEEELLENTQQVQLVNGLKQSGALNGKDFTIEMETGTGKTYVYLRSIFEMNKKYGFTKFIIGYRGALRGDQGGCLQILADYRRTLPHALRQRAIRLLCLRLLQTGAGAQLCHQ